MAGVLTLSFGAGAEAAAPDSTAAPSAHYSYIVAGKLAGHYERTLLPDGSFRFELRSGFGHRSASVTTVATYDARWFPLKIKTVGTDAGGNDATETFSVDNGIAQWKSRAEAGSAFSAPSRFYSSVTTPLDEPRALVLAARAFSDGCVDLLPAGRACVQKAPELRISVGSSERTVYAWAIVGISHKPLIVWLDERGDLFATVSAWASAIAVGWEPAEDQLLDAQDRWLEDEAERQARHHSRRADAHPLVREGRRPNFP